MFWKGHSHIAFVTNQPEEYIKAFKSNSDVPFHCTLLGIATLEDVIEELIQEEIYDEFDHSVVSNHGLLWNLNRIWILLWNLWGVEFDSPIFHFLFI